MKRLHPPDLREFDNAVEAFADLMMERPVRQAAELNLLVGEAVGICAAQKATVTLPDGRSLDGYIRKVMPAPARDGLSINDVEAELVAAMLGTEVGGPTAPYIYFEDKRIIFSPRPFPNGFCVEEARLNEPTNWISYSEVLAKAKPKLLGAMESLLRWYNKFDDSILNRVYDDLGNAAIIDNACPRGMPALHPMTVDHLQMTRRTLGGNSARRREYHSARNEMARRIERYPVKRLREVKKIVRDGLRMTHAPQSTECRRRFNIYDELKRRRGVVRNPFSLMFLGSKHVKLLPE